MCFWACSGVENGEFIGQWIEQISGDANYVQGFDLKKGGQARSIGMQTLQYHGWTINDGKLILSGESIGNGQTCPFDEILEIVSLRNDTLLVKRKEHHVIFVRRSDPQAGDEQPNQINIIDPQRRIPGETPGILSKRNNPGLSGFGFWAFFCNREGGATCSLTSLRRV